MDDKKKPEAEQPDPSTVGFSGSTNEPQVDPSAQPPAAKAQAQPEEADNGGDDDALPPKADLEAMTRAELDALAEEREVDTAGCHTKGDVIDALRKDARKKKRG